MWGPEDHGNERYLCVASINEYLMNESIVGAKINRKYLESGRDKTGLEPLTSAFSNVRYLHILFSSNF